MFFVLLFAVGGGQNGAGMLQVRGRRHRPEHQAETHRHTSHCDCWQGLNSPDVVYRVFTDTIRRYRGRTVDRLLTEISVKTQTILILSNEKRVSVYGNTWGRYSILIVL